MEKTRNTEQQLQHQIFPKLSSKECQSMFFRNYTKLADLAFLHCFVVKSKTRLLISRLKGLSLG